MKRHGPYSTKFGHLFYVDRDEITGERKSVLVHRELMEKHVGRSLRSNEIVHHKDENPSNNELSNLEVLTYSAHATAHHWHRHLNLVCSFCGKAFTRRGNVERANRKQTKVGPFCGKSCSGKWSRAQQILAGKSNLRRKT